MGLCFRQERLLRRTEAELRRSDPHLAAMLTIFAKLTAHEPMPRWERVRTRMGWLGGPLARAVAFAGVLVAQAGQVCAVVLLQAGAAWATAFGPVREVAPNPGGAGTARHGGRSPAGGHPAWPEAGPG